MNHFSCNGCQHLQRTLVGDSFDRGTELICTEAKRTIDAYCDEKDFPPPLPRWCPLIEELFFDFPI